MNFLFRQNSTIYTDLAVIQPVQWSFKPFVSHLLAEGPGLSFSSVGAILPDVDGFRPISPKLDHLYRFSRHWPLPTAVLKRCLLPARWWPRPLDSQCSGNIAWFQWFFFLFRQNSTIYTDLAIIQPVQWSFWPFVSHLLAEDPGPLILNVGAIWPDFRGFLQISSKLDYQGPRFQVKWQYCLILMDFFQFHQNSTMYTDLFIIRPFQWPF